MKRILIGFIWLSFTTTYGQTLKNTADQHFQNGEWDSAARDYLEYIKKNNSDSSAWYNLGFCSEMTAKYDDAIAYFTKAGTYGFSSNFVNFGIAKTYALKGDKEACISRLKTAADEGLNFYMRLKKDVAFEEVRKNVEFINILNKVKLNAYPCLSNSDNRQLDFWVGNWDVYANGNMVGESSINLANGGCAIHESYTTQGNYTGQSINFFDPLDKKWHQYWADSNGGVISFNESERGKGMLQFIGKTIAPNGSISLNRMTFRRNDDGTVRQLIEISTDSTKTWSVGFDGLYKPKIN